jgi:membrane protein YdbS with pleckstrin-like domain
VRNRQQELENMSDSSAGVLIPIVSIIMVFAIPIVAIIMDYRKRALQAGERRAMIEKGMVPPTPADDDEGAYGLRSRSPEALRARSLRTGTILVALGLGLALAFVLLYYVVQDSFIPHRAVGNFAVGAAIVGFLGIGNLVYYWLSAPKAGPTS